MIGTIILTCHNVPLVEGFTGSGIQNVANRIVSRNNSPTDRVNNVFGSLDSSSSTAFAVTSLANRSHNRHGLNLSERAMDASSTNEERDNRDPFQIVVDEIKSMDINAFINSAVIILITGAVLSKLVTVDASITRGWTAGEMAVRIPVDNWFGYSEILDQSPLSTKAITSATVYTIGDLIAQRTEGFSMGELDRPRILRSLLAGLIGHGPLSHLWYDWSDGIFEDVLHWTQWWSFIPKVMVDQTTWGPFWNNTYILLLGLMKMDKLENIWGEMKRTTIPLIVSGLKLWPLAHCVTYGLIPVENRLLWVDLIEIIWVTILATAAAGGGDNEVATEEK